MLLKSMWFQILKSESRQALALGKSRLAMKNPTGNYFVFAQLNVPGPSKALVGVDLALIILIEPFKIKWVFDLFSWFCLFQSVLSRNWSNFLVEILTNLRNFRKSAGFRPISFDFNPERILFLIWNGQWKNSLHAEFSQIQLLVIQSIYRITSRLGQPCYEKANKAA